jgi:hypothetical protein
VTPEQRNRLESLVYPMKVMARRAPTQNEYHRRFNVIEALEGFLRPGAVEYPLMAAHWVDVAEKAAEGHDKPGIVRMPSMAAVLSGMPPDAKVFKPDDVITSADTGLWLRKED